MEVIMEEQQTLGELIQQTYDWLVAAKYSKGTVYSFKCITNQLKTSPRIYSTIHFDSTKFATIHLFSVMKYI